MNRKITVPAGIAGIAAILASVGGPAAVASYHHAYVVALKYGESEGRAEWLPLTTDGMLVAALIVMYSRRWQGQPVGKVPWLAFITGGIATLAANLAAADITSAPTLGDIVGRLAVAAFAPIAFAVTLELVGTMFGFLRKQAVDTPDEWLWKIGIPEYVYRPVIAEPVPAGPLDSSLVPVPVPAATYPPEPAAVPAPARARTRRTRPAVPVAVPAVPADPGTLSPDDERVREEAQAKADAAGSLPSVRDLRAGYGLGSGRATRIRAHLVDPAARP